MASKQPLPKVFIDASVIGEKELCTHCQPEINHLRFFRINPDTEIYKCEKKTCLFPFQKFIYKDIPTQSLYRIGCTNPVNDQNRCSLADLNADLESYIKKYNEEGIPDTSDMGDIIIDLFPESLNDIQPSHFDRDLPNTSSLAYNPVYDPSRFTRIELISSMLQDLEGKYKCKSCEQKLQQKHLKFLQINESTEIFKCESSSCMFPHRNFIFRDLKNGNYYRYKSITSTELLQNNLSQPIPQADVNVSASISDLDDVIFDFVPEAEDPPSVSIHKISNTPQIIESTVLPPTYPIGNLFAMKKRASIQMKESVGVEERKIPTPLELIRNLLKRKHPIEESIAIKSLTAAKSTPHKITTTIRKKRRKEVIKTAVFPVPSSEPSDSPVLDDDKPPSSTKVRKSSRKSVLVERKVQSESLPTLDDEDIKSTAKSDNHQYMEVTIEDLETAKVTKRRGRMPKEPSKVLEEKVPMIGSPVKRRTRRMTERYSEAKQSELMRTRSRRKKSDNEDLSEQLSLNGEVASPKKPINRRNGRKLAKKEEEELPSLSDEIIIPEDCAKSDYARIVQAAVEDDYAVKDNSPVNIEQTSRPKRREAHRTKSKETVEPVKRRTRKVR